MKALLALSVFAAVQFTTATAVASVSCKMELNGLSAKPIEVTASSREALIEAAADKCFDMHEQMTLSRTGHGLLNDDSGITIANACTNVRCR